ncbi:MAG: YceI family protein [Dehalococcoidia bacterium]|nr:YceI family protein [Dehalococcoidia bacterium]HRC62997.1 YceI family protein [Dehalococcoidia bacterium]
MTWQLDDARTEVSFSVEHLMVATVHGRFTEFEADIVLDPDQPERSHVTATIATASLRTDNAERDRDLLSPGFLNADAYPEIRFVSSDVTRLDEQTFLVRGDLTMHGITRGILGRGRFELLEAAPRRVRFILAAEVDRADFDLTFGIRGVLVGKTVTITVNAEVSEEPSAPA